MTCPLYIQVARVYKAYRPTNLRLALSIRAFSPNRDFCSACPVFGSVRVCSWIAVGLFTPSLAEKRVMLVSIFDIVRGPIATGLFDLGSWAGTFTPPALLGPINEINTPYSDWV